MSEERDAKGRFVQGHTHIPGGVGCPWTPKIHRTPENAARICEMIISGMSLDAIGKEMGACGKSTILMWVAQDAEFEAMYRRAKAAQADAMGEEILEIADDGRNDWKTVKGALGKEYEVVNTEVVLRSKLRVDARFRLMGALAPKRYGPKVEVEHAISDSFADRLIKARERALAAISPPIIDAEPAE